MKLRLLTLVFTLIIGCKTDQQSSAHDEGFLIEKPTIITSDSDGNINEFIGYVLIHKNKVDYVGKKKPITRITVKTINAESQFLIPGLIDSHVHLANVPGLTWSQEKRYPKLAKDYFDQLPKNYLQFGFTTLIDVNPFAMDVVNRLKQAPIRPDIIVCGKQVQVMDDFMMETEGLSINERLNSNFLLDIYNDDLNLPDSINLEDHNTKAIIEHIKREENGICVKTLYEDETSGFPLTWKQPSTKIMKDLITEAHKEGLPVILHATSYEGQKFGLETGVDIFAHSLWNWYQNPKDFLNTTFQSQHRELLKEICDQQIGYQLTFRAIYGEIDLLNNTFLNDPVLKKIYSKNYIKWLNSKEGKWGRNKLLQRGKLIKKINPELYQTINSNFDNDESMFRGIQGVLKIRMDTVAKFLSDHKANLLFGTDGVAMNMVTNPPGYNGYLELKHWFNAGISLENIFLAATHRNAKEFHLETDYGTISNGKIANLLLLDQNPLVDISAYNSISSVIIQGKIHKRSDLEINNGNQVLKKENQ